MTLSNDGSVITSWAARDTAFNGCWVRPHGHKTSSATSTQISLHWNLAHFSVVLDLSTCTVLPLHFSQKVYLYHQMKQWLISRDDHKVMMFSEDMPQSATGMCHKCHPVVLALTLCTTERCTYFQSTWITTLTSEESDAAAHCIINSTSCLSKQFVWTQPVCMRPNYIKHPDMLALVSCTSGCRTWTGHMLWMPCTSVTRAAQHI